MRIGIVTTWFERGAAYVSRQYREILTDHADVFVYARGGEQYAQGDPNWDGGRVTWGKKPYLPVGAAIDRRDFLKWLKDNRIEFVLFNEQIWWPPIAWARECGVRTGAYVDYYTEETIPLFAAYDLLFCNTRRHHSAFAWHPRAHYIPWGTDTKVFHPKGKARQPSRELTFFHSAGMNPHRKGTDLLIRAFDQLVGPKHLVIHTQRDLQAAIPGAAEVCERLIGSRQITVIHQTVPAPGLYSLGDVYVYPARLDGIGLTVPEAMACGLPCIVPDAPPMNEFVSASSGRVAEVERVYARVDGYYWPQVDVDVDSLSRQMQWYVDRVVELPNLSQAARNHAESCLDWMAHGTAVIDAVRSCLESPILPFDVRLIDQYEERRAGTNWLLKLHSKSPRLYHLTRRINLARLWVMRLGRSLAGRTE